MVNSSNKYRSLTDAEKFQVHDYLKNHVDAMRQATKFEAADIIAEELDIEASPQTLSRYFKILGYRFKVSARNPIEARVVELEQRVEALEALFREDAEQ